MHSWAPHPTFFLLPNDENLLFVAYGMSEGWSLLPGYHAFNLTRQYGVLQLASASPMYGYYCKARRMTEWLKLPVQVWAQGTISTASKMCTTFSKNNIAKEIINLFY